jgi:hypothetical protein
VPPRFRVSGYARSFAGGRLIWSLRASRLASVRLTVTAPGRRGASITAEPAVPPSSTGANLASSTLRDRTRPPRPHPAAQHNGGVNGVTLQSAAEQALANSFEPSVRLRLDSQLHASDRSIVARFRRVTGPAEAPPTFVVKAAATNSRLAAEMIMNDWAATRLLSELEKSPCLGPRFYGGNTSVPLIVLEDLAAVRVAPTNWSKRMIQSQRLCRCFAISARWAVAYEQRVD